MNTPVLKKDVNFCYNNKIFHYETSTLHFLIIVQYCTSQNRFTSFIARRSNGEIIYRRENRLYVHCVHWK